MSLLLRSESSTRAGVCIRCGQPVEGPCGLSFDDRLVWALGHPDGDRAVLAAQTLGVRRRSLRASGLRQAVDEDRDPYLAVAALRSAIVIAGREELRGWLEQLVHCESFMVREEARRALG